MSDKTERIDRQRLGRSTQAEVHRYADNDIAISEAAQVESGFENSLGTVVLSWNQAHGFTKIVKEESESEQADELNVKNINVGAEWTLGKNQLGTVATVERNMSAEFYFTLRDSRCLLTHDQAQDLYAYLVEKGYDNMSGVEQ